MGTTSRVADAAGDQAYSWEALLTIRGFLVKPSPCDAKVVVRLLPHAIQQIGRRNDF